jgi:Dyp-type peroxidase family
VTPVLDLDDIQGLVARGYGDQKSACFVLLTMGDRAGAGAWLESLAGELTSAAAKPAGVAVNLALTTSGLARLGVPDATRQRFSHEFYKGMADPYRSRVLGDEGDVAPDHWQWGGPSAPVDAMLMLYAVDRAALDATYEAHAARFGEHGLVEVRRLDTADLDDTEPFGFRDGIAQPIVEGLSDKTGSPGNTVKAGEFILGYPNEYGLYTSRPVVDVADDPGGVLPGDAAGSGGRDLGRNGTYLVLRQLAQDLAGFWGFLDTSTTRPDGSADPAARVRLAAKMIGRWPSGAPLVMAPDADDPKLAGADNFGYHAEDPEGLRCPIGAHIRRTNPRDSLPPHAGTDRSIAINKRHRLLRRGREYGATITPEQALESHRTGAPLPDHGLHFVCLNANIARQFEFVQHTWANNPNFNGLHNEPDPLISPTAGADYRIPGRPVRTRLTGLPRFVSVQGGAYFFLPGLRAVRWLASRARAGAAGGS